MIGSRCGTAHAQSVQTDLFAEPCGWYEGEGLDACPLDQ
jgi:hypothetical protein